MVTCTLGKKKTIFGMERENTFIVMEAIITEIGLRVKCKELENYMILMET